MDKDYSVQDYLLLQNARDYLTILPQKTGYTTMVPVHPIYDGVRCSCGKEEKSEEDL